MIKSQRLQRFFNFCPKKQDATKAGMTGGNVPNGGWPALRFRQTASDILSEDSTITAVFLVNCVIVLGLSPGAAIRDVRAKW